jgi:hypothetical protein
MGLRPARTRSWPGDRANLTKADLTGAYLGDTHLGGADLTDVRCPEEAQIPKGWTIDKGSGRLKRLSEVMTYYVRPGGREVKP